MKLNRASEVSLTVVVILFGVAFAQIEDDPLVLDAGILGRIRGLNGLSAEDNGTRTPFVQFRSIPYANVGQRFAPSTLNEQDLSGDGTIFNATSVGNSCHQPFLPEQALTEDCLFLNVYTHRKFTNDSDLRPVIFFIHGGAFTVGQGSSFSGLRMMSRDVVLVSFSYRLGLLGFFSLQTEMIPGNAGMYDIVNALQWTNKYIRHFGGDPTNITIAGQSAGSVSVTALMASPLAQGLFHRAIGFSGSSLNAWGTATDPLEGALNVAQRLVCYDGISPPTPLVLASIGMCMRNYPNATHFVNTLMDYQIDERRAGRLGFAVVSPVVQDFPMMAYPKFLPEHPRAVFARGAEAQVPLWMGTTKHDGSYVLGVFYNRYLLDNGLENNATFLRYQLVPAILESLGVEDRPSGIHETIARTYLGDTRNSGNFTQMYPGLMDIFSVFFFKGDAYETALLHSRTSPTYWSSFDYHGSVSFWASLFPGGALPPFPGGVTHTDDLIYVFSLTFLPFTPNDALVSSKMLTYWADFATVGSPSADWELLTPDNENYMAIGFESTLEKEFKESWPGPGYEAERPQDPEPTSTPPPSPTPVRISSTSTPATPTSPPPGGSEPTTQQPPTDNAAFLHHLNVPALALLPLIIVYLR